jgi:hypothetical protein
VRVVVVRPLVAVACELLRKRGREAEGRADVGDVEVSEVDGGLGWMHAPGLGTL